MVYYQIISGLVLLSIIVSLIYFILMRYNLLSSSLNLDKKNKTPSDFCLMGYNMKFKDNTPKKIEDKVKYVFLRKWNVKVEYVCPAFDIEDFYKCSERFNILTKMLFLV